MNEKRSLKKKVAVGLGILVGVFAVAAIVLLTIAWTPMGAAPDAVIIDRVTESKQYSDGVFVNPQPLWNDELGMLTEMMSISEHAKPETALPVETVDPARFKDEHDGVRVTWLGHSTTIIEVDGRRFLTDPVWGPATSPISWLGPQRWYAPPLALESLSKIDAVLISHDHYDHLDHVTLTQMKSLDTQFLVPLGVGAHLRYWGIPAERIVELDWWEEHRFGAIKVVATPARHASGRHVLDQNRTLWASYSIIGTEHRVFFSGDTGIFPGMRDIGAKLGPFDVVMIEIGAYGQSWPDWHIGPEQAIEAHQLLRGDVFLPIHWGLFSLAYHGWTEPIERLVVAGEAGGVKMALPKPGQTVDVDLELPTDRWWPEVPWRSADDYPIVSTGMDDRR